MTTEQDPFLAARLCAEAANEAGMLAGALAWMAAAGANVERLAAIQVRIRNITELLEEVRPVPWNHGGA